MNHLFLLGKDLLLLKLKSYKEPFFPYLFLKEGQYSPILLGFVAPKFLI